MPTVTRNITVPILLMMALALLLITPSSSVFADDRAALFALPASAAVMGRGTVSTIGAMDASDAFRFPANTAFADGGQFIGGQAVQENGATATYGAVVLPIFYTGALGVFGRHVTPVGESAASAVGLSLSGYDSTFWYGIGGHLAFMESGLLGETEYFTSFGLDFRVDPFDAYSGRVYYTHSGYPLRKSGDDWRLARQFGLIVNYHPLIAREERPWWSVDIGAGAQKTGDDPFTLGLSAELGFYNQVFARVGYERPPKENVGMSGLSIGAGILAYRFGINAAYRFGDDDKGAAAQWAADVKLEIESLRRRTAADNFSLAQSYFSKDRHRRAMRYSRRAFAIDSTHWNAQTLYKRAETELRRQKGNDIVIIYGGNARGEVIPYPPAPDALGGLSRYAAVVSSLRNDNRVTFSIDVGNILSANNNQLRAELAARYYALMNFDAIAPGGGEVAFGMAEFMAAQKEQLPFVVTNLNDDAQSSGIAGSLLLTNDDYKVYVINIIGGSVIDPSLHRRMTINFAAIKSQLRGTAAGSADLRVAVVHGGMEEIRRYASELTELDVIIAGSLNEKFDTPVTIGRTLVVSAGWGNRFAGALTLRFDDKEHRKGRFTAINKLHPVYQEITPDSTIENITRLVGAAIKVEEGGGETVARRARGVIPHLSVREEQPGMPLAFIKSTGTRAEYLLGKDLGNANAHNRSAVFSALGNRAAFIYGNASQTEGKLRMVDLATMNGRTVSTGKNVMDAAFSPAVNFLYYIEADSGSREGAIRKTKMFMQDALPVLERDGNERADLFISNDGETILFSARGGGGRWHIYAMDSSGISAPARLTDGNADHRLPRQSPNGRYIAYLSDRGGFGGQMDLWLFERGKNRPRHKQITTKGNVRDFTWDDDSETIYFSFGANVFEISGVDINGEIIFERLIPPPANAPKTWHETTPRFRRVNGAPGLYYVREPVTGEKRERRIHRFDLNSRSDGAVYSTGEHDEWLE